MQSFMPTRFFVFKIQAIKNGFAGPKSFRGFRETGLWAPGPHFSKVPKRFRARKVTNKVNFHAKFNAYTLLSF